MRANFVVYWFTCATAALYADSTSPKIDAVVDWCGEKIVLSADWQPGRLITVYSNAELRQRIRDAMLMKLSALVDVLWQRSRHAARDGVESPDLTTLWPSLRLSSFQVAENRVHATMEFALRGTESLLSYLPLDFGSELVRKNDKKSLEIAYDKRAQIGEYDNSDQEPLLYTGLVIDARHLPFVPSLNSGIYTANGRQIYGAEFLSRATVIRRGTAGYHDTETHPAVLRRVGERPLKVPALDLAAGAGSSVVISEEDAAKLLAHEGSKRNLSRARVVIIVKTEKLREKL